MAVSKHIISALIAASTTYAAICSSSDPLTIENQSNIDAIASCPKYTGDIVIKSGSGASLDFGSLPEITGDLSMDDDDQITSLSFPGLSKLGSLGLTALTRLDTLDLSNLTEVGDIVFKDLDALNTFNFGKGLKSAGAVSIENVQIQDLSGIASATTITSVVVANCQFLSNIEFNFTDVDVVDIGPNNYVQGQTINLPNLKTATSLFLRNSTAVNTPSLTNVSDTLGLYGNTFQTYAASKLQAVGALVLQDNPQVTNFSFPSLVNVNGENATLDIENNTLLATVDGFPKLEDVQGGGVTIAGNIKNVSLPSITDIGGALTLDTTVTDFDCSFINGLGSSRVAKGEVKCVPADPTPTGSGGTSSGNGGSGTKNAAGSLELPTFLTTGAFAALLALLA